MAIKFKFESISILFFVVCKLLQGQICDNFRSVPICCSNYRLENGKCVACPAGLYSMNCSKPCPNGFYGEFCANRCSCTAIEICHFANGCIEQTKEQQETTTGRHEKTTKLQHTQSREKHLSMSLVLYLGSAGCTSLFFAACFLVMYRRKRSVTVNEEQERIQPVCDAPLRCRGQEVLQQFEEQNADEMILRHKYTEIIDVDSTYIVPCSFTPE